MYLRLKNKTNYTQLSNSSTLNGCKTVTESLFPVSHGLKKPPNLLYHRETASQFMSTRERVLCLFLIYPAAICMTLSSNGNHTTPPCLEYRPCICQSPLQHTSLLLLVERGFEIKLTKKRHLKQLSLNFNA